MKVHRCQRPNDAMTFDPEVTHLRLRFEKSTPALPRGHVGHKHDCPICTIRCKPRKYTVSICKQCVDVPYHILPFLSRLSQCQDLFQKGVLATCSAELMPMKMMMLLESRTIQINVYIICSK